MEKSFTSLIKNPEIYNGKELWEYYHSLGRAGSRNKLESYALSVGMFDPDRGKPSKVGPLYAMYRYAFENPEEAYPAWEKWAKESAHVLVEAGKVINYKSFVKEIANHAERYRIRSKGKIDVWLKEQLQKA